MTGALLYTTMRKAGSTRLAIVEKSLHDTMERLSELPAGPRVRELKAKADSFERALHTWSVRPPTEEQRTALLRLVLDLNVEVMAFGRGQDASRSDAKKSRE
jgi:hypothetical protein